MLVVFEGPDGVGKTTLAQKLASHLVRIGKASMYCAFPGKASGSLGCLVNDIHHHPLHVGVSGIDPTALQLLHVAAHIDQIERVIRPAINDGTWVILDRFWWSTIVYGTLAGAREASLHQMVDIEQRHWGTLRPAAIFLLKRLSPARRGLDPAKFSKQQSAYESFMRTAQFSETTHILGTDKTIPQVFRSILKTLDLEPTIKRAKPSSNIPSSQKEKGLPSATTSLFAKLAPAKPTAVYDTFWKFAVERQLLFFRRWSGDQPPWTQDPILCKFKFTNAYRASDRTSQFLIKEVSYTGSQEADEVFFRILLFKLFNKIETWNLLKARLGTIELQGFDIPRYDRILTEAKARGPIYSGAYIMPSGGKDGEPKKHLSHLRLLKRMISDAVPAQIQAARSLESVFETLKSYPMMGDFLAYQYTIDLNYSNLCSFNESQFVIPGPGARDGIRKCFASTGGLNESDLIRLVTDRQTEEFARLGLQFPSLWGRPLQLIDCQNLFCEVDKYARLAHPEIVGISGRTRIKQAFHSAGVLSSLWYPPKWGINDKVEEFLEHRYDIA